MEGTVCDIIMIAGFGCQFLPSHIISFIQHWPFHSMARKFKFLLPRMKTCLVLVWHEDGCISDLREIGVPRRSFDFNFMSFRLWIL
jgi:hypothetical protein